MTLMGYLCLIKTLLSESDIFDRSRDHIFKVHLHHNEIIKQVGFSVYKQFFKATNLMHIWYGVNTAKGEELNGELWTQCYKTFYRCNLPPFHGHTIILCYKATLPW